MTKVDYKRKDRVCKAMYYTALHNGKETDLLHIISVAERLHRLETTLSRLSVEECDVELYNRYWKDGVNENQERKEKLAMSIIEKEIGCKAYTQRDPRGYAIRMYLVDEYGEKWHNQFDGVTSALNW